MPSSTIPSPTLRWLPVLAALTALALSANASSQTTARASGGTEPALTSRALFHRRLEALAQQLDDELETARHSTDRIGSNRLAAATQHFRREVDLLERDLAKLGNDAALRNKLLNLARLVDNLERATTSKEPPPDLQSGRDPKTFKLPQAIAVPRDSLAKGVAPPPLISNDDCANATEIALDDTVLGTLVGATNDGSASCGGSAFSPDVWFKFTSQGGNVRLDTFGSDFDTVVSVHTACPGVPANQAVCNDDSVGLDSAASFYAYSGQTYWIRLAGFNGATGAFELHVGEGGAISGTVTNGVNGDPIEGARVEVFNPPSNYYSGSTLTDAAGGYTLSALSAGDHLVATDSVNGFVDELYDNVPCYGGAFAGCSADDGTTITVNSVDSISGIDFALSSGGTISGLVTQNITGSPIEGAVVAIYDSSSYEAVSSAVTAADGSYAATGLVDGTYYAKVSLSGYVGEVYNNLPASSSPLSGTPISVTSPQTTPNIDFQIDRLGVIEGVVTESSTGNPIIGASVSVTDTATGYEIGSASTLIDGTYSIAGLNAGSYTVAVRASDFLGEAFDDIPCDPSSYTCNPAGATALTVGVNNPLTGIDFALDRLGMISGTVTDAGTMQPVASVQVRLYDDSQSTVRYTYTNSSGIYTFDKLLPDEDFFALAYSGQYVAELYDDLPCILLDCDPTSGTPLHTQLNAVLQADFELSGAGTLSGYVTSATTGDPLGGDDKVEVFSSTGDLVATLGTNLNNGYFSISGLPAGGYYVSADDKRFVGELFASIPCPGGPPIGCDLASGNTLPVSGGTTTVYFSLDPQPGVISGMVRSALNDDPIPAANIEVYDSDGNFFAQIGALFSGAPGSGEDGSYVIDKLPLGDYFLVAGASLFEDELYQDLACPSPCDPTTGTRITVGNTPTTGIDFTLDQLGRISGVITDEDGQPLTTVYVRLWNSDGEVADGGGTSSNGSYLIAAPAGTYFLSTDSIYSDYVDELYADIPCLGGAPYGCDPTKGNPIVIAGPNTETTINFSLAKVGLLTGVVTDAGSGMPIEGVTIDIWSKTYQYIAAIETTDENGHYSAPVRADNYYVATRNDLGFVNQLFDGVSCPDGSAYNYDCSWTDGTLVNIPLGTTATVDFALTPALIFTDGFESGDMSRWTRSPKAPPP